MEASHYKTALFSLALCFTKDTIGALMQNIQDPSHTSSNTDLQHKKYRSRFFSCLYHFSVGHHMCFPFVKKEKLKLDFLVYLVPDVAVYWDCHCIITVVLCFFSITTMSGWLRISAPGIACILLGTYSRVLLCTKRNPGPTAPAGSSRYLIAVRVPLPSLIRGLCIPPWICLTDPPSNR